jgi:sec-independent protein translocase protein TatA
MDPCPVSAVAIFDLSGWHILVILIVALLLFGRRLPEIMRGLGSSVKEFRKGMTEEDKQAASAAPPQRLPDAPAGTVAREAAPPSSPTDPPKA